MSRQLVAVNKTDEHGRMLANQYNCRDCSRDGESHEVVHVPGPPTGASSTWGPGLPTTMRHCTRCGAEDGPWVSADIVGGGW